MFRFLIKRILNNKWLFLCLLIGALSTVAVVGAMPMYVNGIFQKVLTNDLRNQHMYEGLSPTRFTQLSMGDLKADDQMAVNMEATYETFNGNVTGRYPMSISETVRQERLGKLSILTEAGEPIEGEGKAIPTRLADYKDHVIWQYGRMPETTLGKKVSQADTDSSDEIVLEVAVSTSALKQMKLAVDRTYQLGKIAPFNKGTTVISQFKIVGVFTIEDENALFWSNGRYDTYAENIVFDWKDFERLMEPSLPTVMMDQELTTFYDYQEMKINDLPGIVRTYNEDMAKMQTLGKQYYLQFPVMSMLGDYQERQKSLKTTLWIVMVPLLIIMAFYAVLVSNLIVKQERNEIAVLKSRGAARRQIFLLYLMESVLIGVLALAIGPFLSRGLTVMLGASNGFLEFVQRAPMETLLTKEVYLYSGLALLLYSICILIPVIGASRMQIVLYKQSLLGDHKKAFWHRTYLDVVLLVVSLYGLYSFKSRQDIMYSTGASADQMTIDPLLFFISTLFILGISILFLRIYPWLVKLVFMMLEKTLSPVAYFSLVNVAEGNRNLQAIMLFLILSISFGLMSANQARTINQNALDKLSYEYGAEVVIEPYNNLLHLGSVPVQSGEGAIEVAETLAVFEEPPYPKYEALEGGEALTKVYQIEDVKMNKAGERFSDVHLMGIRTNEFGEIAWFRQDLLPYHLNEYLNLLAGAPKAVLLSSNYKDSGLEVGDEVTFQVAYQGSLKCRVYGFVDYFPGFNPYDENGRARYLAVVNDFYMDSQLPLRPYEIWMNKKDGVTDTKIYEQIVAAELELEAITFLEQATIKMKNDPLLLGMNGSLTMCFMVEMIISAVGFIIFWLLSMQERRLKFGIFRAIGMPLSSVNAIMMMEQLLVSGMAILMGFVLGSVSSELFVPLLEVLGGARDQVPPFVVVSDSRDYLKVLLATGVTLLIALVLLIYQVMKTNVNQIIKLGEDS